MLSLFGWGASADARSEDVPKKMRRWTTLQDGIAKMKLEEDVDVPEVGDGEVLIKVKAVGLSYRDVEVCKGTLSAKHAAPAPLVPASELCGTVIVSKSTDKQLKPGTRVTALPYLRDQSQGRITRDVLDSGLGFPLDGVLAEYVCLPGDAVLPVPGYLSDAEVTCLARDVLSSWTGLASLRQATGGESSKGTATVLLHGTTCTATSALQLAKLKGWRTIATSSSDGNLERAEKELKADETINTLTHWEWAEPVLDLTSSLGADVIFAPNGSRTLRKSLNCVAVGGSINLLGYTSTKGEEEEQRGEERGTIGIGVLAQRKGVVMKGLVAGGKECLEEVIRVMEKEEMKPVVGREVGFEEVKKAMEVLEGGEEVYGKVVVRVS